MGKYNNSQRDLLWYEWGFIVSSVLAGTKTATDMPSDICDEMRENLRDIPFRDALLANSVQMPEFRPALKQVFAVLAANDDAPSRTMLAAMQYLDDEIQSAEANVQTVLEKEEYSLARLLSNGIEFRAPSSLLARSFGSFDPLDLLHETA